MRKAAVLVPLIFENGTWKLLFEVRALNLDTQPGEVCFPGGMVEEGESEKEATLREVEEELFVMPDAIAILGELPAMRGPYGKSEVKPFVGVVSGYSGDFSRAETDHVFTVPISALEEAKVEEDAYGPVYVYRGERIWGFTARVIAQLLLRLEISGSKVRIKA